MTDIVTLRALWATIATPSDGSDTQIAAKRQAADRLALEVPSMLDEIEQARTQLAGMTGERDDERKISQEWERKCDALEAKFVDIARARDEACDALESATEIIADFNVKLRASTSNMARLADKLGFEDDSGFKEGLDVAMRDSEAALKEMRKVHLPRLRAVGAESINAEAERKS